VMDGRQVTDAGGLKSRAGRPNIRWPIRGHKGGALGGESATRQSRRCPQNEERKEDGAFSRSAKSQRSTDGGCFQNRAIGWRPYTWGLLSESSSSALCMSITCEGKKGTTHELRARGKTEGERVKERKGNTQAHTPGCAC
jgi:hypothetical protein